MNFISKLAAALMLGAVFATSQSAHAFFLNIDDTVNGQITVSGQCFGNGGSFIRVNGNTLCQYTSALTPASTTVLGETVTIALSYNDGGGAMDTNFAYYFDEPGNPGVASDTIIGTLYQQGAYPMSSMVFTYTSGGNLAIPNGASLLGESGAEFYAGNLIDFQGFQFNAANVAQTPEPEAMLLFGIGLLGLGFARRRKA